ncbi:dynein light chain Tctex-type 5 [Discoglossus pictus]
MSDIAKDKAARLLMKRGSVSSISSHEVRPRDSFSRPKDSMSTVSYMDEPGQHEEGASQQKQMENTYQLGPTKRFPVVTVNNILKDVLAGYLHDQVYDPDMCRQLTKTISEVVKARVKELMIPRYKIVVLIHIGQLKDQSMVIGSQCLWNATVDTCSSSSYKNGSLYGVGTVYAVYYE